MKEDDLLLFTAALLYNCCIWGVSTKINMPQAASHCHYSHFFAVRWTHKIAIKNFSHAQSQGLIGRAF